MRDTMTRTTICLLAAAATLAVAGCSGGSHSPTSPPTARSATPPAHAAAPIVAGGSPNGGRACGAGHFRLESLPTASRQAHRLLARMTLKQEVVLMRGAGLNGGTAGTSGSTEPIPALKVPALTQNDGPAGVGDADTGVTQLPAPIALAATFDPAAARCYGKVIGSEARAKGIEMTYGPTVNLVRVPQWGRAYESLGEDPHLSGTLAAAEVGGMQGAGEMAQVKHFAVYNQETYRNTPADDVIVAQRTLQEIYLKLWREIVAAQPASVMCAYSTINGQPACQDAALLHGFLDQQLGFTGFVGSDYNSTHSTVAAANAGLDQEQPTPVYFGKALLAAVSSGRVARSVVDQAAMRVLTEMYRFRLFTDAPPARPHAEVETAADVGVARTIAEQGTVLLKNSAGALPLAATGSIAVIGPAATGATATSGAGSTAVISPGTVTPLRGLQSAAPPGVAVSYTQGLPTSAQLRPIPAGAMRPAYPPAGTSGRFAASVTPPATGTYLFGFTATTIDEPVTLAINGVPLLTNPGGTTASVYSAAIQLQAGQRYKLTSSGPSNFLEWATPAMIGPQIAAAAAAAAHAHTAVVVVADSEESEGGDRANLTLPSAQDQLIDAVAAANPRTVVVVEAGGAVTMPWLSKVDAVVDQWYSGETDGTSLAAVVFGSVNPSGHLPVTFPASSAEIPIATARQFPGIAGKVRYTEGLNVGYRWWIDTGHRPLFPFGFGLSYTTFHYGHPVARLATQGGRPLVTVRETVKNTGTRSGADVAQVYLGMPKAVGEPARQLEAYRRVSLPAGGSATVLFRLQGLQLAAYLSGHWEISGGGYRVYVGDSSARAQLSAPVTVRLSRSYLLL
ncbi:MAG TPA: glycoside hydrolase family 3 C-terminal domain-containing protein [Mycobacteriales bacterium]|nr:glycoside hydrolase family 3 C-terminal domain-containing protein [Mycobacteriales bacterium]